MAQVSSRLMKKYANEAFNIGGGSQTKMKPKSKGVNETIGFNLFGEN